MGIRDNESQTNGVDTGFIQALQPGLDVDLQLPRFDTTGTETAANDTLDLENGNEDAEYYEYSSYPYDYSDYEYYEYENTRRKRQPKKKTNEVEGTLAPSVGHGSNDNEKDKDMKLTQNSGTFGKKAVRSPNYDTSTNSSRKRRKNENASRVNADGMASPSIHSPSLTDHHQSQQQEVQRASKKQGKHRTRIEDLHPLKAFGLRFKRRAGQFSEKPSAEDVTWI